MVSEDELLTIAYAIRGAVRAIDDEACSYLEFCASYKHLQSIDYDDIECWKILARGALEGIANARLTVNAKA